MKKRIIAVCVAGAVLLLAGCGLSRREQLHRVAKDWCETIRASQVIAVYPLTQDVQPGDVFLVQTPIDQQQQAYKDDGFLPLDNHLARLNPSGYSEFYRKSFLDGNTTTALPTDWLKAEWKTAPSAAFPSYAFSASKGGGLNLAIPVSGVPVGLSLLGTQSATGTISLKDARTIGVDTESLYFQLTKWAYDKDVPQRRDFLASFAVDPGKRPKNYLRVITRVYLLGAIDVQLNDARSFGAGVDAGAARPVELFLPEVPKGTEDVRRASQETYVRGVQRLNAMGGTGVPRSSTGADPGLSSEEFAARKKARAAERKAEMTRARDERDQAKTNLESAKTAAAQSTEGKALAKATTDLDAARTTRQKKEEALRAARAEKPPDDAKIEQATQDLAAAETDAQAKEQALVAAQQAYDEKQEPAIQQAAGKLDVKESALERLQGFAPGASFRFNAASARSVSMTETFDVPLVVGYLGFDVPIGVDGELGPPIPTHARLRSMAEATPIAKSPALDVYQTAADQNLYDALSEIAKAGDPAAIRAKASLDGMTRFMPPKQPKYRVNKDSSRVLTFKALTPEDFGSYIIYREERKIAIEGLNAAATAHLTVTVDGTPTMGDDLRNLARSLAETPEEARAYKVAFRRLHQFWLR